MDGNELKGLTVVVVEDEPIFATEIACAMVAAGGSVVGPAYSLAEAFDMIGGAELDGALLDLNLRNEKVFSLADALADRGVPIVFVTGEIWPVIPERHAGCRVVGKPVNDTKVVAAISGAISERSRAAA
jgi:DNA-binding response OmpR family regulator